MKCVAYDPFITKERAAQLGVEMMSMADLFKVADVITVHTPLIAETKHVINAKSIATMKDGVRIINCARGGIIDEKALYDAITSGKVAGAALDVFETEPRSKSPLLSLDQVIVTPHLGASTGGGPAERRGLGGQAVYRGTERRFSEVRGQCTHGPARTRRDPRTLHPASPRRWGGSRSRSQVAGSASVELIYGGELSAYAGSMKFVTRLALKGLLDPILQQPVNIVNAEYIAKERGITVSETVTQEAKGFKNLITIRVKTDKGEESVSGTVFFKGRSRIVAVGGYTMDMIPEGYVIVSRHLDKPGVIGRASTILGKVNINIAGMQVGRINPGEQAIMVLNVDSEVPVCRDG